MSRLRRLVLSGRFFFVTCRLGGTGGCLSSASECLARGYPRFPLTISRVMESIKVGSTLRINGSRKEQGLLWQPRFFHRALRTVKEYHEKAEYVHQNPVRPGLVRRAEDWQWSSVHDYTGTLSAAEAPHGILPIDRWLERSSLFIVSKGLMSRRWASFLPHYLRII